MVAALVSVWSKWAAKGGCVANVMLSYCRNVIYDADYVDLLSILLYLLMCRCLC